MNYGEQIRKLKLVQAIGKAEGRDNLSRSDVEQLHAMVLGVADKVGDLLAAIPMTFRQYTKHDLLHAWNLIDHMGRFIPPKSLKQLNAVELTVLALVAMLHDFGMYVDEEEKQRILEEEEFTKLLEAMPERKQAIEEAEAAGKHYTAGAIRDAVLADYFRKLHPERARKNINTYLAGVLRFREHDLSEDIASICESHGWGVFDPTDPRHPEQTIEKLKTSAPMYGVPFNPQFTAICLRLADIMDFDRSRTPLALLKTITDKKSQSEWMKHLSIRGWTISDREVVFHARCAHPEHYVAVMEFLDWVDAELRDCRRLLRTSSAPYVLTLPSSVDRFEVEMANPNYLAGAFRFELDYERIMKLLMDRSLYPDPSLFLRELLQNSLDACRVRMAMAQSEGATDAYTPRITVWDNGTTIIFQDNGIGMSRSMVEKYFMRVGRSYYRSVEFEVERKRLLAAGVELEATSQFGIGFLSCFMVADRIEIDTWNDRSTPLHVVIEGPTKYFTIEKLPVPERPHFRAQGATAEEDCPPMYPGTRITVHLRTDAEVAVRAVLELFAVNVEVPVTIIDGSTKAMIPVRHWERSTPPIPRPERRNFADIDIEGLATVLMPWDIPLERTGLAGRLWFWMLRDAKGHPVPRLGNLVIAGELQVIDPIRTYSQLKAVLSKQKLRSLSVNGLSPARGINNFVIEEFNPWWKKASESERQLVSAWLKDGHGDQDLDRPWFSSPGCSQVLATGDESWTSLGASFHAMFPLDGPEQLALHGIALPAGIARWEPMTGEGSRINLFYETSAGCRLDARRHAPTPAANRLFIDSREGRKVTVPVLRAILRFTLEALETKGEDQWWNLWGDAVLRSVCSRSPRRLMHGMFATEAVWGEQDVIHRVLRLQVSIDGEHRNWTIAEARNHFGRWAPLQSEGNDLTYSTQNRILLLGHPTKVQGDQLFIDLDTVDRTVTKFPF